MKLTDKIQVELMKHVCSHAYDIIIPNFYLAGYEMDLMRISRDGRLSEYEIKVSKADFRNDFEKGKKVFGVGPVGLTSPDNWRAFKTDLKHDKLAARDTIVNRYWFVAPAGLLDVKEIPKHAGLLIYITKLNKFEVVKNAPLLNKQKPDIDYKLLCNKMAAREGFLKHKLLMQKLNAGAKQKAKL